MNKKSLYHTKNVVKYTLSDYMSCYIASLQGGDRYGTC